MIDLEAFKTVMRKDGGTYPLEVAETFAALIADVERLEKECKHFKAYTTLMTNDKVISLQRADWRAMCEGLNLKGNNCPLCGIFISKYFIDGRHSENCCVGKALAVVEKYSA